MQRLALAIDPNEMARRMNQKSETDFRQVSLQRLPVR
jgi:hypothetical protein